MFMEKYEKTANISFTNKCFYMPCFKYLLANLQCDIVCIAERWGFAVLYDCNVMEPYDYLNKTKLYRVPQDILKRSNETNVSHIC